MAFVVSGSLEPNKVKQVTVDIDAFGSGNSVGILNRSQDGTIWVRIDGTAPTVGGDNCFPVMQYREFSAPNGFKKQTVKMISDVAVDFTVEGRG